MAVGDENREADFRENCFNPRNQHKVVGAQKLDQSASTESRWRPARNGIPSVTITGFYQSRAELAFAFVPRWPLNQLGFARQPYAWENRSDETGRIALLVAKHQTAP
jgi:hypothetical protein